MKKDITKTMKRVIMGGLCGCFITVLNAGAQEVQNSISLADAGAEQLAMLTDMENQAKRRAWLAKMRSTLELDRPDPDAIIVEEIVEEPVLARNELSRDLLNSYIDTISAEIIQPQK